MIISSPALCSRLLLRVVTSNNIPLDNAVIIGERGLIGITDEEGYFLMEGGREDELVTIYRYGFEMVSLRISDLVMKERVFLKKEAIQIEGITVIEQRGSLAMNDAMRIIIPVTAEMRGKKLSEILQDYPEVTFSGTILPGERLTVSILGHQSRHTLVLLDGIPLNSSGQPYDLSVIPTELIENIELIKGGGGAYKGTGSLGGLININTKHPVNRYDLSLAQSAGSFGYYKTSASIYRRSENFGLSIYADKSKALNDFRYYTPAGEEQVREFNDKAFQNLHLRISSHLNQFNTLYKLEIFDFANKLPGPTNYESLYRDARLEGNTFLNHLSASLYHPFLNPELVFYYHRNRTDYDNTRAPYLFYHTQSRHKEDKRGLHFKLSGAGNYSGSLTRSPSALLKRLSQYDLRLEYNREDFSYLEDSNEASSITDIIQENYAAAAGIQFYLPVKDIDWNQSLNGRFDHWLRNAPEENSAPGSSDQFFSWRYDSAFTIYNPLFISLGGGISRNQSLPSFYDLYWKGDSQTTGNPYLRTEKSLSWNLFGEFNIYNIEPKIEYYHSNITDLIYWYRSISGWKPGNLAAAEISNLILSANYHIPGFLNLSASWVQTRALNKSIAEDGSQGDLYNKKLIYTPEENLSFRLRLNYSIFYWTVSHSYTGIQWSTPDQLIPPLDSYHVTDTEAGLNFKGLDLDWQLSLSLNNIFDTRYEIYAYTPQPGFNWLFNLRLSYKK